MTDTDQKRIYSAIDKILWLEWDPIGINDSAPRNEYYGYIPSIFNLKISGADKEIIASTLFEIETLKIGVVGNMDRCRDVADKIFNIE
jgi:hypothetical protein